MAKKHNKKTEESKPTIHQISSRKFPKNKVLIGIIVTLVAGGLAANFLSEEKGPSIDTVQVELIDLVQEVSVTGGVKPAEQVDLSFENSGKVSEIFVDVGSEVKAGDLLIRVSNGELSAQVSQAAASVDSARAVLQQYEATLENARVTLEEIKKGTRPEEVQIAKTVVNNAEIALNNAQLNLEVVQNKADTDLDNLYDSVPDVLSDTYTKANDVMNNQVDELFDVGGITEINFTVKTPSLESDARFKAGIAAQSLTDLMAVVQNTSDLSTQAAKDVALVNAKSELENIRSFLVSLDLALNDSQGLSEATENSYKLNINTARASMDTALASVRSKEQAIASQFSTNSSNLNTAESTFKSAENTLSSAKDELLLKEAGSTPEQVAAQEAVVRQQEANVASQKAQVRNAQANVNFYYARIAKNTIKSPISGVVTKMDAEVGEIVSSSVTVVSVSSQGNFEIETFVPEVDIATVKIGDPAELTLDAYRQDVVFSASVVSVDPGETVIQGVSTYKVTLQFSEPDERIKSGMTANVDIVTAREADVLAIPQRAVLRSNGDKTVRLLKGEEIVEVIVETGILGANGWVEIVSGLEAGDEVITFIED